MNATQQQAAATAFAETVASAQSQSAFERRTGLKQQTVSNLLKRGGLLPAEYVLVTEREFGVSRHLLRPDIYPVEHVAITSDAASIRAGDAYSHFDRAALSKRDVA